MDERLVILIVAGLLAGLEGVVLHWTMQLCRYAVPKHEVPGLRVWTWRFGFLTLAALGLGTLAGLASATHQVGKNGLDSLVDDFGVLLTVLGLTESILVAVGICVMLVSLHVRQVEEEGRSLRYDPLVIWLLGTSYLLMTVGVAALLTATVLVAVLPLFAIGRYQAGRRNSRRCLVLWTLTLAAEGRRPFGQELRDCAAAQRGVFQLKLLNVIDLLDAGYTLSAALESVPGLIPDESLLMIRMGEETGSLPAALRQTTMAFTRQAQGSTSRQMEDASVRTSTVVATATLAAISTSFMGIYIVPKYKAIFSGFALSLPEFTQGVLDLVDYIGQRAVFLIVAAFGLGALATYLFLACLSLADSRLAVRYRIWGIVRPRVTLPVILRCLAVVIRAGRPLPGPLRTLADHFPCLPLRGPLGRVSEEVAHGEHVWTALKERKLLTAQEQDVLVAADRAGNLSWAMEELAEGIDRRRSTRVLAAMEVFYPVLVVSAGLLVLCIDATFFLPLVEMLQHFSEAP